jgi:hypothetical protein
MRSETDQLDQSSSLWAAVICSFARSLSAGATASSRSSITTSAPRLARSRACAGRCRGRRARNDEGATSTRAWRGSLEPDMGQSPSHVRPAISHDRDGRHEPRTAGDLLEVASSTPDTRHTGADPVGQHPDRARLPARDRTPRRGSLSGGPAREARPRLVVAAGRRRACAAQPAPYRAPLGVAPAAARRPRRGLEASGMQETAIRTIDGAALWLP